MTKKLVITNTHLTTHYHGTTANKNQEWPPTWFRVYAAIIDSLPRLFDEAGGPFPEGYRFNPEPHRRFLDILERLEPPTIYAIPTPRHFVSGIEYVPNNDLDKSEGSIAQIMQNLRDLNYNRTEKARQHTPLPQEEAGRVVQYAFDVSNVILPDGFLDWLGRCLLLVRCVGTGKDLVLCRPAMVDNWVPDRSGGKVEWRPTPASPMLIDARNEDDSPDLHRVPRPGCFDQLQRSYRQWEMGNNRREANAVAWYRYLPEGIRPPMPWAAFQLVRPAAPSEFALFDNTSAHLVARMASDAACTAWTRSGMDGDPRQLVLGKFGRPLKEVPPDVASRRMYFLPLPTIDREGVSEIRRILVAAPFGLEDWVDWASSCLDGVVLRASPDGPELATLSSVCDWRSRFLPKGHSVLRRYVGPHRAWASVSPVMLRMWPRRPREATNDKLMHYWKRVESLAAEALCDDGFGPDAVKAVRVGHTGFIHGLRHPSSYRAWPTSGEGVRHQNKMLCHVLLGLAQKVEGPVVAGGGRHTFGMGVLAGVA